MMTGSNFTKYRNMLSITKEEFCERFDISMPTLIKYEKQDDVPRMLECTMRLLLWRKANSLEARAAEYRKYGE